MRIRHLVAAAAAISSVAFAGPANATVCNVLTDPSGDAVFKQLGNQPGLDILSADVASDATYLTTVVRVADIDHPSQPSREFEVWVDVNGKRIKTEFSRHVAVDSVSAAVTTTTNVGPLSLTTGAKVPATATFDTVNDEVRVSMLLADLAPYVTIASGDTISLAYAETTIDGVVLLAAVDWTTGSGTYAAGAASCVTPGT